MYTAPIDIDALLREDVPYFDLTSFVLDISEQPARIEYFTRENCIVCGTEEGRAVLEKLNIRVETMLLSGEEAAPDSILLAGTGKASSVFTAWKVVQNLLDHASGIATKTAAFVRTAKRVNPGISVLTTRKMFPGTKALAIKAVMAGGALPHRLGVSETVLVFPHHCNMIGGFDELIKRIPQVKAKCCEKLLLAETSSLKEAFALLRAGADGIQFEKLDSAELKKYCGMIRTEFPGAVLLAAGGIREENIEAYAASGVNGLVTTGLYTAKPTDIGVRIRPAGM